MTEKIFAIPISFKVGGGERESDLNICKLAAKRYHNFYSVEELKSSYLNKVTTIFAFNDTKDNHSHPIIDHLLTICKKG